MSLFTRTHHMGAAALIMGCSVFLSRLMGLVRDKVISYFYGAGAEADIYFAAFVIPDFINYLLAGGYFSITLIPLLSRRFNENREEGWAFFSSVFWWVTLASVSLVLAAWIMTPVLVRVFFPDFSPEQLTRLGQFLRVILPAQVFFLPGACLTALLYWRKQFTIPALTPLVYNGCIICGGLLMQFLSPEKGMLGFCWGVLAGAVIGNFSLPLLAARQGDFELKPLLRHPGLMQFIVLALPLMLGQSIVALDEQFIRIFGAMAGEGSVSLLSYARRIMLVPVGVVAQAAGVASYPFLASLAASGDMQRFAETMNTAMRNMLALVLPLCIWMATASLPLIRLIFQQGRFTSDESVITAALLAFMLSGVAFWSLQQMVGRAFYARENTITPAVAGTGVTLVTLPLYWAGAKYLGAYGVALAGVTAVAAYALLLAHIWVRRNGKSALRGLIPLAGKALGISLLPGAASLCVALYTPHIVGLADSSPLLGAFLALTFSGLVFAALYLPFALRIPVLAAPLAPFLRRLGKRSH